MKTRTSISTSILFAGMLLSNAVSASEASIKDAVAEGEQLHDSQCLKCHGDEVYTRENRRVKSMDALGKQVRRCRDNIGIAWFDEETDAVVQFLNQKYYRF